MDSWTAHTTLGPYVLVEPIGSGGMGEVWKAHDTRLDRTVAIKRDLRATCSSLASRQIRFTLLDDATLSSVPT